MPFCSKTPAAIATVVLTGLVMMQISAFGQVSAQAPTRFLTIPALILKRSERSIPGLRATPAEIKTISALSKAGDGSSPVKPLTFTAVGM